MTLHRCGKICSLDNKTPGHIISPYEASRSYTTGCFVCNLCQELADTNTAVAEKAKFLFRSYIASLARCIRNAQDT